MKTNEGMSEINDILSRCGRLLGGSQLPHITLRALSLDMIISIAFHYFSKFWVVLSAFCRVHVILTAFRREPELQRKKKIALRPDEPFLMKREGMHIVSSSMLC